MREEKEMKNSILGTGVGVGGTEKGLKHQRSARRMKARGQRRADGRKGCELEPILRVGDYSGRKVTQLSLGVSQLVPPQEDPCSGSSSLPT